MIVIVHFTVDVVLELYQKLSLSKKCEIYPQVKIYPSVEIKKNKTFLKKITFIVLSIHLVSHRHTRPARWLSSERLVEHLDDLNSISRTHGERKKTPKSKLLTFTHA